MKKVFIALAVLVALGTGAYLYFHKKHQPVVNDEIKKRLVELVHDGSNGLYTLKMDSLEANVVDLKLTLFKARLVPDTVVYQQMIAAKMAPQDLFEVSVDKFSLDNISPIDFLTAKEIKLDKILISNPVITIRHNRKDYQTASNDSTKTVFQRLQDKVSQVKIDTIFVQNADVTYFNVSKKKNNHIDKVSFLASDFLLAENTQNDSTRFLFAKNCRIQVLDYAVPTPDSLYQARIGKLSIETARQQLEISEVHFTPRLNVKQFYQKIKHQQDRFNLAITKIRIHNIDWWSMLGDEALTVHRIDLSNMNLDIFNDKSMPRDTRSKVGKYPQQLLMNLSFGLKIDTLDIKNMDLAYTELNPKTGDKGTLLFSNIDARIYNVTNDSASILQKPFLRATATAKFMKEAPVNAEFLFDLKSQKQGNFEVNAKLGKVSAEALNRLTIPLGLVKIEKINLHGLEAKLKGNNLQASGSVKLEYEDLKIAVLKNKDDTVAKRKLISFIANSFVLKNQNPDKGKPIRISQASFKRDVNKSFFNLVWKTIFTGAKSSVGYK